MQQAQNILKANKLRLTNSRKVILDFLLKHKYALAHADIEDAFDKIDRVTIYRTLATFMEKGIVHQVSDDTGATKYAMCSEHCTDLGHHDEHVHFKCVKCTNIQCIDTVKVPNIELPEGFRPLHSNYLIYGICKDC